MLTPLYRVGSTLAGFNVREGIIGHVLWQDVIRRRLPNAGVLVLMGRSALFGDLESWYYALAFAPAHSRLSFATKKPPTRSSPRRRSSTMRATHRTSGARMSRRRIGSSTLRAEVLSPSLLHARSCPRGSKAYGPRLPSPLAQSLDRQAARNPTAPVLLHARSCAQRTPSNGCAPPVWIEHWTLPRAPMDAVHRHSEWFTHWTDQMSAIQQLPSSPASKDLTALDALLILQIIDKNLLKLVVGSETIRGHWQVLCAEHGWHVARSGEAGEAALHPLKQDFNATRSACNPSNPG